MSRGGIQSAPPEGARPWRIKAPPPYVEAVDWAPVVYAVDT